VKGTDRAAQEEGTTTRPEDKTSVGTLPQPRDVIA
jgi:hypothetical protein